MHLVEMQILGFHLKPAPWPLDHQKVVQDTIF